MPNLNLLFNKLNSSKELKEFKSRNKGAFLYACFYVSDGNWQFDFYNPKDRFITTFEVSETIKVMPIDRAFDTHCEVAELDLKRVKVGYDKAVDLIQKFIGKECPGDKFFTKTITILQNLKKNVVWNVTFLTSTLKLLNVKLDASSGKVLSHTEESFLSMR